MTRSDTILYALLVLGSICVSGKTVNIKIIGAPFSIHGRDTSHSIGAQQETKLITKVHPEAVTGPAHLQALNGQCFVLLKSTYKYEFCPFQNVTQREQSYRWNAYSGVLGVWREWMISDGSFEGMLMTHGDTCVDSSDRSVKVHFQCANESKLDSVHEPATCKYEMVFKTPLVCPTDAMYVFPVLNESAQARFKFLMGLHSVGALPQDGYDKMMTDLYMESGLMYHKDKKPIPMVGANNIAAHGNKESTADVDKSHRFLSKLECLQEYEKLLLEVQQLRRIVANHTNATASPPQFDVKSETIQKHSVATSNHTLIAKSGLRGDDGTS